MNKFLDKFEPYNLPVFKNGVRLPEFKPTKEQYERYSLKGTESNLEFLTQLCRYGFKEKIQTKIPKEKHKVYIERIKEELSLIDSLGFTDYILMVWDICDFCDQNDIPRGPGRGSVSSSMVCFLTGKGITQVDPIKYGTFLSRFISKARAKSQIVNGIRYIDGSLAPDVDLDIDFYRRHEVVTFLNKKYLNRTANLLTIQRLKPRILLKDILKSYFEFSDDEAKEVSDLIRIHQGQAEDLDDANSDDADIENPRFKEWLNNFHGKDKLLELNSKLSLLSVAEGKHASALLISYEPIDDIMPLKLSKEEDCIINNYDMNVSQTVMLKFDLLGLKNCSVISECCKLVGIKPEDIDIDDPSIYQFFQEPKHLYGIFQFESFAQGSIAQKVKPKNFKQVVDSLSISRPGASSFLGKYLDYIHKDIYEPIHPVIDDVLKETGGVCLFQEQYLKLLVNIGMSQDDAEIARKALAKKKEELIPEIMRKIQVACDKNGHSKQVADLLLKIAQDSAGYQFALAHALAYGMISVQTVYLKQKYPVEFTLACLNMAVHDSPKKRNEAIQRIISECRERNIQVLPPNILLSEEGYSIRDGKIVTGLSAVKGVAGVALEKIKTFDKTKLDKFSIIEGLTEAKIPINVIGPLVLSGCLTVGTESRSRLQLEFELWKILTPREKPIIFSLGEKYNYDLFKIVKMAAEELKNEKNLPLIKESRFSTIKSKIAPFTEKYRENVKNEDLSNIIFEQNLLGFNYSNTLIGVFSKRVNDLIQLSPAQKLPEKARFKSVCFVDEVEERVQKSGKKSKFLMLTCRDESSTLKGYVWGAENMENVKKMNGRQVQKGDLIIGHFSRKHEKDGYLNEVVIQDCPTIMKVSELREKE